MICKNASCRREIEEPLIIYNGEWICPYCKEPLVNNDITFQITKESNDLFKLSELLYLYSIKEKDNSKREFYINSAVTNCRLAVELGHPEAYVRLGYYYDKDYIELNRSEVARCQMAYQYYSAVCFSGMSDTDLKIEKGIGNVSLLEVKKKAALLMLRMLSEYADGDLNNSRFNYLENAKKIKDTLGVSYDGEVNKRTNKENQLDKIYSILWDCKNKKRAPIFGLFTGVKVSTLERLFTMNDGDIFTLMKTEEVALRYYTYRKNSKNKLSNEGLLPLSNRKQVMDELDTLKQEKIENVVLIFFNKKNGHNLLKKKEVATLEKLLLSPTNDSLFNLASTLIYNNKGTDGRIYYDDDIYYYFDSKSHNVNKALNILIEN